MTRPINPDCAAPTRTCECGRTYVDDPGGRRNHQQLMGDQPKRKEVT